MPFSTGVSFSDFIGFFFFRTFIKWAFHLRKSCERFHSSLRNQLHRSPCFDGQKISCDAPRACPDEGLKLSGEDFEVVMKRLGLWSDAERSGQYVGDKVCIDADEMAELFDEREPSFEELNDAFKVFDEDGDGFVGPQDLQRVLCNLGFKEGLQVEECERMISVHDRNGDGRVDFEDFAELMRACPC